MATTFEKVAKILADHKDIGIEDIKSESTFEGLGLDSLDTVELVMDCEEEFGISIAMDENLKTVGDFVKLIEAAND